MLISTHYILGHSNCLFEYDLVVDFMRIGMQLIQVHLNKLECRGQVLECHDKNVVDTE